ncbi:hypothetical protein BAE44_0011493, partial [Dichanthelium oligosanthes]
LSSERRQWWHSSSRILRTPSRCSARSHNGAGAGAGFTLEESWRRGVTPSSVVAIGGGGDRGSASFRGADGVPPGLHLVYVGNAALPPGSCRAGVGGRRREGRGGAGGVLAQPVAGKGRGGADEVH